MAPTTQGSWITGPKTGSSTFFLEYQLADNTSRGIGQQVVHRRPVAHSTFANEYGEPIIWTTDLRPQQPQL